MADDLIFCVEGGGTKSKACLVNADGAQLTAADGGACNPSTGRDSAVATFAALWRQCCAAAGYDTRASGTVVLSIAAAGLYVPSARSRFLAAIPSFARTVTASDGYAALIGAGGGQPCGIIIIGTGVAGHRLWPNGRSIQRDAWGWIGGDRGSGAWLGIRALRHTLGVVDGIVTADKLSEGVLARIGGRAGIAETLSGITPDRLAAFAPLVLAAADEGVASADAICDRAIAHLAALARRLDIGPGDVLYASGGLAATFAPRIAARIGHAVAACQADALRGCFLLGTGRAPAEQTVDEGQ
jgi:glucosamine kinase